ncbi:MAG: J domain-containing protein [Alphaproteobacteria bacterium]|nr:MAG: J domain-containing protein [Alphaproteobacteria bacterium]
MRDPYQVLGVARSADISDIKQAYRALAKRYHPDLAPNSAEAGNRFKEISLAYGLLSNSGKRAEYDRGIITADGRRTPKGRAEARTAGSAAARSNDNPASRAKKSATSQKASGAQPRPRPRPQHQPHSGPSRTASGDSASFKIKADEVVNDLFASVKARSKTQAPQSGADQTYTLTISFEEAARGTIRRVKLPDDKRLDVKIPAGVENRQIIRLRGQGAPGLGGGEAGDALIEIDVAPHKHFSRKGHDVLLTVPIGVDEAILGAKIMVPTLEGPVAIKVPPQSNTDTVLSIPGAGFPLPGDGPAKKLGNQLVVLKVILPPKDDTSFTRMIKKWAAQNPYEVTREFDFSGPSR